MVIALTACDVFMCFVPIVQQCMAEPWVVHCAV